MEQQTGLIAVFSDPDTLGAAVKELGQARLEVSTIYSPTGHHALGEAMGLKPSPVRSFTLIGGLLGTAAGFGLSAYTAAQWSFNVGGRPVFAWVPFVVVGFECTILLAVLFTVAGMLICSRLPQSAPPGHYDSRFTRDKFGILIACPCARRDEAEALLKRAGAEEIHEHRSAQQ